MMKVCPALCWIRIWCFNGVSYSVAYVLAVVMVVVVKRYGKKWMAQVLCLVFLHRCGLYLRHGSFVHSLLQAGVQPTLDPSSETFYVGPVCQPRERKGICRCVQCA